MAAPTQAFPPWLSSSPVTLTQDGTVVVQTTVIQFPQTYYGPSIPLGPGWVFGGSTFPASIATSFASPTPSTSVTSSSSPTQTTTSPSITPSTTTPSSSLSSSLSPSSSPSPSLANFSHGISSGTRLAIILSTVLGTLMLAALLVVLFRIRRRRQHRSRALTQEAYSNFSNWQLVNPSATHVQQPPEAVAEEALTQDFNFADWQSLRPFGAYVQQPPEAVAEEGEATAFLTSENGMREHPVGPMLSRASSNHSSRQIQVGNPTASDRNVSRSSGSGSAAAKSDSSTLDSAAKREDLTHFNASGSTMAAGSLFFNPAPGNDQGNSDVRKSEEEQADATPLTTSVAATSVPHPKSYAARPPGAKAPLVPTRSPDRPPSEEEQADTTLLTTSVAATSVPYPKSYAARPRGAKAPLVPTRSPDRPPLDPAYNLVSPMLPEEDDPEEQFRPPRLLDPDNIFPFRNSEPSSGSRGSWVYPDSPPSETDERAMLLTARRVNVGSVSHPVLASPTSEKRKSHEDWTTSLGGEPDDHVLETPPSPGTWAASVGLGGLTGFARGLGRLSWFKRMEEIAGPSGTRHSTPSSSHRRSASGSGSAPPSKPGGKPGSRSGSKSGSKPGSRPGSKSGSKPGSRPTSGMSMTRPGSGTRRHSGLLHPPFAPRPRSDVSFHGIDAEVGMRPPGIRISGTGSGSGGSGSGKSGATLYHSVSSRPQTPMYASALQAHHEGELLPTQPTIVTIPPDMDLGDAGDTIRSVDVLDLPVPERTLPFSEPLLSEPALRPDTASSRATGLAFPPGLVAVPQWDRNSHSSSSNRKGEEKDLLEDDPPQAGGEWSSLRSKRSANDVGDNANQHTQRSTGPVTRNSIGEQAVQVIVGDPATSETASFSSALRRADPSRSPSMQSPTSLGFVLTPSVSVYTSSHSDLLSQGSHSSRPSQHTTSHSHSLSHHSSNQESEDGHLLPRGPASHRASLSAMGGNDGPPQIPPLRPLSNMQPTMERTVEVKEAEEESGTNVSRPGTGTSRPTMSEATYAGTLASGGSASTGAPTTVPSTSVSSDKQ